MYDLPSGDSRFQTPTIEKGVRGRRNEKGLRLRAPHNEELVWDLEMEIVEARREWLGDDRGWWVASSYLQTVIGIVLRSFPSVLIYGEDEDRLLSRDGKDAVQGRLL
jgi:hypothetical protein